MNGKLVFSALCACASGILFSKKMPTFTAEVGTTSLPSYLKDLFPITTTGKLIGGTPSLGIITRVRKEVNLFLDAQLLELLKVRIGLNAGVASTLEVFLGDLITKIVKMVSFLSPETLYGPIQLEVLRFIAETPLDDTEKKDIMIHVDPSGIIQHLSSVGLSNPAMKLVVMPLTILRETLEGIDSYREDFHQAFPDVPVTTEEIAEHLRALLVVSPESSLPELIEELANSDIILRSTLLLHKALSIPMEAASLYADMLFGVFNAGLSVTEAVLQLSLSPLVAFSDLVTLALVPVDYVKVEASLAANTELRRLLPKLPRFEITVGDSVEWHQNKTGSKILIGPLLSLLVSTDANPGQLYSSLLVKYPKDITDMSKEALMKLVEDLLRVSVMFNVEELPGGLKTYSEVVFSLAALIDARMSLSLILGNDLPIIAVASSLVEWGCSGNNGKPIVPTQLSDVFCQEVLQLVNDAPELEAISGRRSI